MRETRDFYFLTAPCPPIEPLGGLEVFLKIVTFRNPKLDAVYVCSGPLYLPKEQGGKLFVRYQVLGQTQVAVPTHFFKILLIEKGQGRVLEVPFLFKKFIALIFDGNFVWTKIDKKDRFISFLTHRRAA